MRIFDRYIGKQILNTTLYSVIMLSGVFLLGNIFKEARPLFVGQHPSPYLIVEFILNVFPFSLIFTIPFSFLASTMIVFGRLSTDNEIIGMRMAGLSLPRIAAPVFACAALLSGLCFWLNVEVAPKSKERVRSLLVSAVKQNPNKFLDPGVVQTQLANKRIYVEKRVGDILHGVHIHDIGDDSTNYSERLYTYAERAELEIDLEAGKLQLKLEDATLDTINGKGIHTPIQVEAINPVIFDFNTRKGKKMKPSSMSNGEIHAYLKANPKLDPENRYTYEREITYRRSFSLACVAFSLVGIPLGIASRRKESSKGFLLSLAVGLCYFMLHIYAHKSDSNTRIATTFLYWAPNLLAIVIGCFLFYRKR